MSIFNINEEERRQIEKAQEYFSLDKDWYKIQSKIALIDLPYYLIGVNPKGCCKVYFDYLGRIEYYSDACDGQPFVVIKEIRQIIFESVASQEIKTVEIKPYNSSYWDLACEILDVINWLEVRSSIEQEFPLRFSDKVVEYIKSRHSASQTIKNQSISKEKAKPAYEKIICFLVNYYSTKLTLIEGQIAKSLYIDMQSFYGENCPAERSIYDGLKSAQLHHPEGNLFIKNKKQDRPKSG